MKACVRGTRTGVLGALAGALLLASTVLAEDGPVKVTAKASATDVSVGQPFLVEVEATGPAGAVYAFPETAGDDKVELRLAPPPSNAPPPPNRRSYQATAFALDEVAVPAVAVGYKLPGGQAGSAASQTISLKVETLLPKGDEGKKPADIRPPVSIPVSVLFWVAVGLGVAVLAGLVVWLVKRRRPGTAKAEPAVPVVPPDVEARLALEGLTASGLAQQERFKEFYVTLVEIAKRYLERRLEGPVLEMTSHEVVGFLRDHAHCQDLAPAVRDLTNTADFVKFAKGSAAVAAALHHLDGVRSLVQTLESRLAAPSQGQPGQAPGAGDSAARGGRQAA
jgi:hypothetical protein